MTKLNTVYFLQNDEEILYIGTTTKGFARIQQHKYNKTIPFTRFTMLVFNSELDAKNFELKTISLCLPKYNRLKCEHQFLDLREIKKYLKKVVFVWEGDKNNRNHYIYDTMSVEPKTIQREFFIMLIQNFPLWLQGKEREKYVKRWMKGLVS